MKFKIGSFLVLVSVLGILYSFVPFGKPLKKSEYQLVWKDEFSKDGNPDQKNWNYETGFVRNQEDQWYQKENAFCKNGF